MSKINPAWIEYNKTYNEGAEGYNPHPKFVPLTVSTASAARMIAGKRRTHADAVKFAKNCLSSAQKDGFMVEVKAAFPELY
jgi:hypothetical protein